MVIRKPRDAYVGRLSGRRSVGTRHYGGVGRPQWFGLNKYNRSRTRPQAIADLVEEIYDSNGADWNLLVSRDLEKTKKLLAFANAEGPFNEICAVYSDQLAAAKGTFDSPVAVSWLGVDPFVGGYGSLLEQGFFTHPLLFESFDADVNAFGLLDADRYRVEEYVNQYLRHEAEYDLERMSEVISSLQHVAVGSIADRDR